MSKRRKPGEWVRLPPNTGFVGESNRLRAQIQPDTGAWAPCIFDACHDPDCQEWETLWTEPDPSYGGIRHTLCHVSECDMMDAEGTP